MKLKLPSRALPLNYQTFNGLWAFYFNFVSIRTQAFCSSYSSRGYCTFVSKHPVESSIADISRTLPPPPPTTNIYPAMAGSLTPLCWACLVFDGMKAFHFCWFTWKNTETIISRQLFYVKDILFYNARGPTCCSCNCNSIDIGTINQLILRLEWIWWIWYWMLL